MQVHKVIPVLVLAGFFYISGYAQNEGQKWRSLTTAPQLLWVEATQLDTITVSPFEIWIVELHKPPLTVEGIPAKVNRTKTLYAVNRAEHRYGVKKVVYYDNANKEIWQYDYKLQNIDENLRYNFPIPGNSFLLKVFELLDQHKTVHN